MKEEANLAYKDEAEVLDRKTFRNKLPLRKLLYERVGIDSDKIGKYFYGFPISSFLEMIKDKIREEVLSCKLWDKKEIEKFWRVLEKKAKKNKICKIVYRNLFFLSAFVNHSKYLKSEKP